MIDWKAKYIFAVLPRAGTSLFIQFGHEFSSSFNKKLLNTYVSLNTIPPTDKGEKSRGPALEGGSVDARVS